MLWDMSRDTGLCESVPRYHGSVPGVELAKLQQVWSADPCVWGNPRPTFWRRDSRPMSAEELAALVAAMKQLADGPITRSGCFI